MQKLERAAEDVEEAQERLENAQRAVQGPGLAAYFNVLDKMKEFFAGGEVLSEREMENVQKLLDLMDAHEELQAAHQAHSAAAEQY